MFLLLNNLIVIFKINVIIKEFNNKHIFRVIKTFNNEIVNNEIFI